MDISIDVDNALQLMYNATNQSKSRASASFFPQPSSTSWTSGGSPMIFGQPESRVLDEEESETPIFQDFGDRWQNMLYFDKAREKYFFWYFLFFQDGAVGRPLLAEKEGAVERSYQRGLAPSSVYLELAVSDHQRTAIVLLQ